MAADSKIEWTDHTFNPWWGCTKVSPGCDHCYAERMAWRQRVGWGPGAPRRMASDAVWVHPDVWQRRAEREGKRFRVFCASMADVFDNEAPDASRVRLFDLIEHTPNLDWLLLTKRIGNAARMVPAAWLTGGWPRNVWLGISVVNQDEADRDIPKLIALPARARFLSCEPLLGPIDLTELDINGEGTLDALSPQSPAEAWRGDWAPEVTGTTLEEAIAGFEDWGFTYPPSEAKPRGLDWVIVGGESGPGARIFNLAWARAIVAQCAAAGVPCFVKQLGRFPGDQTATSWRRLALRDPKGGDINEWPEDLRVRQFPLVDRQRVEHR